MNEDMENGLLDTVGGGCGESGTNGEKSTDKNVFC